MIALARQLLFLVLSAGLTWWFLLRPPTDARPSIPESLRVALESAVAPPEPEPQPQGASEPPAPLPAPEPAEDPEEPEEAAGEPLPPPPELGAPDGEPEGEAVAEASDDAGEEGEALASPEGDGASPVGLADPAALAADEGLLERAEAELAGTARQGFSTELVASAGDQLDIARAFGESLVLVPWDALDAEGGAADWFRLALDGGGRVERLPGPFEPGSFRFHRDLFDYDYAELPSAVRALRRAVVGRDQVYLFAALIPTPEWAVVVGRRDEALARLGLTPDQVRRFTLRYVRRPDGRFDLRVTSIERADGRRERLEP